MKAKKSFIWLGILLLATIWILVRKNNVPYHSINGLVFGTIYNITYQYDGDLKSEIEAELKRSTVHSHLSMTLPLFHVSIGMKKL